MGSDGWRVKSCVERNNHDFVYIGKEPPPAYQYYSGHPRITLSSQLALTAFLIKGICRKNISIIKLFFSPSTETILELHSVMMAMESRLSQNSFWKLGWECIDLVMQSVF